MIKTLIKGFVSLFLAYGFFKFTAPVVRGFSGALRLGFVVIVGVVFVVALAKVWGEGK